MTKGQFNIKIDLPLIFWMIALLTAYKPLIFLDFHKSFNDTPTKRSVILRMLRFLLLEIWCLPLSPKKIRIHYVKALGTAFYQKVAAGIVCADTFWNKIIFLRPFSLVNDVSCKLSKTCLPSKTMAGMFAVKTKTAYFPFAGIRGPISGGIGQTYFWPFILASKSALILSCSSESII